MKSELLEDLLKNSITKIEDKDSTIAALQYRILELQADSVIQSGSACLKLDMSSSVLKGIAL